MKYYRLLRSRIFLETIKWGKTQTSSVIAAILGTSLEVYYGVIKGKDWKYYVLAIGISYLLLSLVVLLSKFFPASKTIYLELESEKDSHLYERDQVIETQKRLIQDGLKQVKELSTQIESLKTLPKCSAEEERDRRSAQRALQEIEKTWGRDAIILLRHLRNQGSILFAFHNPRLPNEIHPTRAIDIYQACASAGLVAQQNTQTHADFQRLFKIAPPLEKFIAELLSQHE